MGKDSTFETIAVIAGLATAADVILTGDLPPLFTSLMNGDTSILSNPTGWFRFFGELGGGGGGATAPTAPGAPAAPAGGGGDISQGECPAGGETCVKDNLGRYDCESVTAEAYEATWCGTFSGDDLTIKMYGPPHHSDGDCCWCVVHVSPDGTMSPGGEGPHPSSNCNDTASGKNVGKATCYKAVMRPGPIQEGYALIGGKWVQAFSKKGPCGCSKQSSTKTGNQVTFRCDGSFNTKCATVKPLGGGGVAATAPADAAAATPPPAEGGEKPAKEDEKATKAKFARERYYTYYAPIRPQATRYYNGRMVY